MFLTAGFAAVILCTLSALFAYDSCPQFHEIGSLLAHLDGDVLALVDQEIDPLRDRRDIRSDLRGLSRIVMKVPQHA
jgi:hypothetical protein